MSPSQLPLAEPKTAQGCSFTGLRPAGSACSAAVSMSPFGICQALYNGLQMAALGLGPAHQVALCTTNGRKGSSTSCKAQGNSCSEQRLCRMSNGSQKGGAACTFTCRRESRNLMESCWCCQGRPRFCWPADSKRLCWLTYSTPGAAAIESGKCNGPVSQTAATSTSSAVWPVVTANN